MRDIDTYVLKQVLGPFLFFVVIFGGIIWLNQALRIVDIVINSGQPGLVFAEMASYLLPKVGETVLPISGFAAAVYLANRLYSESELVVMMSVGRSPAEMTRPFWMFGGVVFVLMSLLTHVLSPAMVTQFEDRSHEISKEFLGQFIVDGAFSTPTSGVTIFFGRTSTEGQLEDILINDRRNEGTVITHAARTGQLVQGGEEPKLVLFEGSIQRYTEESQILSTVQFDSLSYDLGQFAKRVDARTILAREMPTLDLLFAPPGSQAAGLSPALRLLEGHGRFVKSLLAVVVPVIGALVLIASGYSRSGFLLRITAGVVFMVAINSLRGVMQSLVADNPAMWPVLYTPVIIAIVAAALLIRAGGQPFRPRKQPLAEGAT